MKKIKIGVLGTASIARRYVIPAIQNLSSAYEIIGIASRDEEKAIEFAAQFNVSGYETYEKLLEVEALDAVYIPLPNSLHYKYVKMALNKGLHVLVEKSIGCNLKEVQDLVSIARKRNLALVENFQFRFHPQLKIIKDLVEKGEIGELRLLKSSFGFPPFPDANNIRYQKDLGGGSLLDAGAYPLKVTQEILGRNIKVVSSSLNYDDYKGVDIWGDAYLKNLKGTCNSQISFGFDNYYQCSIEIWGSTGKISTNRVFTSPPGYRPEIVLEKSGVDSQKIVVESADHFEGMLNHFYKLIVSNDFEDEYIQNILQADLIEQIRILSNAK